jgi:hypothetical protein
VRLITQFGRSISASSFAGSVNRSHMTQRRSLPRFAKTDLERIQLLWLNGNSAFSARYSARPRSLRPTKIRSGHPKRISELEVKVVVPNPIRAT